MTTLMNSSSVSVIIPCYNHADYLSETIQGVLDQTYRDFELVIVNDGSTDHTAAVVQQFHDSRIKYIEQKNRGATAARNTGMRASSGNIIALLDADDLWHPEKLQVHLEFLNQHPEVGVTYNARFELNHSVKTIRALQRPPITVTLADFMVGFPFSPSDMVVRREWALKVNLFDEHYVFYGDDLDFYCRLALAGCQFASVDRALNYRRYHAGRVIKNMAACVEFALRPLEMTFAHPNCPPQVLALRDLAFAKYSMTWAILALSQSETALGQELLCKAIQLNPAVLEGAPCDLVKQLLHQSILDGRVNHEELLHRMFEQLPAELSHVQSQLTWAVAQGYVELGVRAIIWNRFEEGEAYFIRAGKLGVEIDDEFLSKLTYQLLSYEKEFGDDAVNLILQDLLRCVGKTGNPSWTRRLRANYLVNQAFKFYRLNHYHKTVSYALQAAFYDPTYFTNRGVISIILRSIQSLLREKFQYRTRHSNKVSLGEASH